jgi:hypothetical protein
MHHQDGGFFYQLFLIVRTSPLVLKVRYNMSPLLQKTHNGFLNLLMEDDILDGL